MVRASLLPPAARRRLKRRLRLPAGVSPSHKEAEREARQPQNRLVYWTDGSRLDTAATGAGVAWKSNTIWKEKAISLGKTKEVFDAELYAIQETLKLAYREHSIRRTLVRKVIIFSGS